MRISVKQCNALGLQELMKDLGVDDASFAANYALAAFLKDWKEGGRSTSTKAPALKTQDLDPDSQLSW